MRNADKIKALEKELGRYRKKVADQAKENAGLRQRLQDLYAGNAELQRSVDAILAMVALTYGEEAKDEETRASLGYRISISLFLVDDVLEKYEIRARRDDIKQEYIIGVVPRETGNGRRAENDHENA